MLKSIILQSGEARTVWAARLGITKSYLSELLNGNRTPSLEVAVRIQRVTNGAVPAASWLPEDTGAAHPGQSASDGIAAE